MNYTVHVSDREAWSKCAGPDLQLQLVALGQKAEAKAFLAAAASIDDMSDGIPCPKHILLCHAVELILKADLMSQGENQERSRDLAQLLGRAKELGYSPSDRRTDQVVERLRPLQKDFTHRPQPVECQRHRRAIAALEVVTAMFDDIAPSVTARHHALLSSSKASTHRTSQTKSAPQSRSTAKLYGKTPAQHRGFSFSRLIGP